jgi:hypothetical protein
VCVRACREGENEDSSTYPKVRITIREDLSTTRAADERTHGRELLGARIGFNAVGLSADGILEQPRRVLPLPQHQLCIRLLRLHNALLDIMMNGRFQRAHEPRPHINARSAQVERGGQALAVAEAAGGDEGNGQDLAGAVEQDEVGDVGLADVAGAFEAVDGQEVDAELDGAEGVPDGGALVQDDAGRLGFLEHLDDGAGRVAGRLDDADAFVEDGLRVARVVGRVDGGQQGEVDAEGLVRHALASSDLLAQGVGRRLGERREDSESAGVGHRRGHFRISHPLHAALHDGHADPQLAGEGRVEGHVGVSAEGIRGGRAVGVGEREEDREAVGGERCGREKSATRSALVSCDMSSRRCPKHHLAVHSRTTCRGQPSKTLDAHHMHDFIDWLRGPVRRQMRLSTLPPTSVSHACSRFCSILGRCV